MDPGLSLQEAGLKDSPGGKRPEGGGVPWAWTSKPARDENRTLPTNWCIAFLSNGPQPENLAATIVKESD